MPAATATANHRAEPSTDGSPSTCLSPRVATPQGKKHTNEQTVPRHPIRAQRKLATHCNPLASPRAPCVGGAHRNQLLHIGSHTGLGPTIRLQPRNNMALGQSTQWQQQHDRICKAKFTATTLTHTSYGNPNLQASVSEQS